LNQFTPLDGKKVLLIVTGGIAAYKACSLVRDLRRSKVDVRVVMTDHAAKFVAPLTFATLTGHPVNVEMFPDSAPPEPIHLEPVEWADALVVAPATANFIGKMASGIADDLASTIALAYRGKTLVAPAMNPRMWDNPAVQRNLGMLYENGVDFVGPELGAMAGVKEKPGYGRMSEPEAILAKLEELVFENKFLLGRSVLVTTGPTREAIDPVRYISNRSSGRMGDAVARVAAICGAQVTLIRGEGSVGEPPAGVGVVTVSSAAEMASAVKQYFKSSVLLVMTAAVADWTVSKPADQKLKKHQGVPAFELTPTEDILAWAGKNRKCQVVAGFALETENHQATAREKLKRKDIHLIALNDPTRADSKFGGDSTQLTLISHDGAEVQLPVGSKQSAAYELLKNAARFLPECAD